MLKNNASSLAVAAILMALPLSQNASAQDNRAPQNDNDSTASQTTPQNSQQNEVDSENMVVVTGTHIERAPNDASPSPITSIGADMIQSTGQSDVTEALREIPSLANSGTIADSIERGDGGFGQAILDLRGLGAARTLVVVNGKRHVSGVAGSQIVDVATIPNALIERVDVLTGGASAVYGADAVTGVVNYVLKDDFEGLAANAQGGISSKGDGFTGDLSLTLGKNFSDNRGNFAASFGYSKIDEIRTSQRDYMRNNNRFNSGQTYPHPDLRFQKGEIDPATMPNFATYFTVANGSYPYGFSIPQPGSMAYNNIFANTAPTAAEQALIDRAINSPALAFQARPAFAISSFSGLIFRNDYGFFTADINNNGINDCEESFVGTTGFGGGGCYVSTANGGVKIFEDGIIASDTNQFGGDGAGERSTNASVIPENERYFVNFVASYEFSPAAEIFIEGKYVRSDTMRQDAYNSFYDSIYIAPDNPFIPDVLQADADDAGGLRVSRDFMDQGAGATISKRDTYRLVGGIKGEFAERYHYEIYGNYGRTDDATTFTNSVLYDRLFAAIDAVDEGQFLNGTPNGNIVCRSDLDPNARHPGSEIFPFIAPGFFTFTPGDGQCVPMSLFNGPMSSTQAAVNFTTTPTTTNSRIEQLVFGARLTGDFGSFAELPGGKIQFSLGAEYRDEKSRTRFDPLVKGILPANTPDGNAGAFIGDISSNQSLTFDAQTRNFDSAGSYDVFDLYGELRLPIFSGQPWAEQMEISAAARYSKYSNIGGTFSWNVNGVYAPVKDIRFRATYAKAVRAPNIAELFDPEQGTTFRPADPCDLAQINSLTNSDAAAGNLRRDNCYAELGALGFDFTTNPYQDPLTARFSGTTGGNPNLEEETARTWTAGALLQPSFIPGLTLSVDYYNIIINNAISAISAQDIVDSCYDSSDFTGNIYCPLFTRDTNAASPLAGGLTFLRQRQLNFGKLETDGIDISLNYQFDIGRNRFALAANANWVNKLNQFFDPTDDSIIDPELGEQGRPEWAATGSLSWTRGDFTLGYRLQFIDEQALAGVEIETAAVRALPVLRVKNLSMTYRLTGM